MKQIFSKLAPTILMIILTLLFSTVAYRSLMASEQERCWQILDESAQSANREIQLLLQDNLRLLNLTSSTMNRRPNDPIGHINAFQSVTSFSRMDVLYPDDTVLLQTGERIPIPDGMPSFSELSSQKAQVSRRTTDAVTGEEVIYCFMPVMENGRGGEAGKTVSILVGVLNCADLPTLFHPTVYNGAASICLVDLQDGSFLMDSYRNGDLGNLFSMAADSDFLEQLQKEKADDAVEFNFTADDQDMLLYCRPVGMFDWALLVVVPHDVAFASLNQLRHTMFAIGAVELILLGIYLYWNLSTLNQLRKSKAETVQQLNVSNTLIECVTELSSTTDIDLAINRLLGIICRYFHGDRAYIFDIDYGQQTVSNTYEYVADGVTREIDHLQNVPISIVSLWLDRFREVGSFYLSDVDVEKHGAARDLLKAQNIRNLVAVPLLREGQIIGFVGVDNPREHGQETTLLSSIQFFVSNSLDMKLRQQELHYLSFHDNLTNLFNRNKYMQMLDSSANRTLRQLGAAYLDLNGLKTVNDQQGHEAGDALIRCTAQQIDTCFPRHAYRVGEDEFVILVTGMEQSDFETRIRNMKNAMVTHSVSVSIGSVWREECTDLEALLKEVDRIMYADKSRFYSTGQHDRRKPRT